MDPPAQASDVFSLSDHLLAERLQFVKEIGFGNWGSVWLCHPKSSSGNVKSIELAVKLVHRSKTSTTAARVRSLWNEMKIVGSFKHEPHPSIVPFHSFIITPSYALITMTYLPTLVPVEVSETRAKEWFKSLLSGVHFLHSRGVVHNDIKPANILLSRANVPVLVDFGFAEKYDLGSPKAFYSNLTYGTPEYLSPERARGLPHDTRKSDVWSLGVTFFEILVGRTPFEYEEGETFEKKEDLERYWLRTVRGKWVGTYSISQSIERFLRRMIVPNAELRCTATEVMEDPYWDVTPTTLVPKRGKSASIAVPFSAHARKPSAFDAFKHAFKDKEKDKEQSQLRLLDISFPWSASKSTSRSSLSRPASRTETTSRPASRIGARSPSVSRGESTRRAALGVSSTLPFRNSESPSNAAGSSNSSPMGEASPICVSPSVRMRTHSRSKSQPKLRVPPGLSTAARTRKLSTVQASPIVNPECQTRIKTESEGGNDGGVRKGQENTDARKKHTLISLNSNSSLRRPLGPRQPSPRVASITGITKKPSVPSERVETALEKRALSHLPHLHTPGADHTRTRAPHHLLTPRNISQTSRSPQTPLHTTRTSQQASISKQLSGKPPRTRGRAGILVDLTGFARNVDLGTHGVGHPTKHVREKRDKGKENTKGRPTAHKPNKENDVLLTQVHTPRKDVRVSNGPSKATPLSSKTRGKEQDTSITSIPLVASLSSPTKVTKGSVRDRMMDWERERERLREMVRLADASTDGHGDHGSTILSGTSTGSDSFEVDDSCVQVEIAAEVASAQAKSKIPQATAQEGDIAYVEGQRPTATQSVTTISSSSSHLERSQIEVARLGVRASAQILSSQNGSVSALMLGQSVGKRPSEESQVENPSVTDIGLPVEIQRNGESGLSSLKHSVKASIDRGMRFYKSSTLGQLTTGRSTPAWCASPEPIDFEQRRSGEEGRFSWENIRPEHEIALDRMNSWIQSVEKVVEETRQNFAFTSVTPPAALPLAPISRSSSQYHGILNPPTPANQNSNNNPTLDTSRLPRRLAANKIFAELKNPDAPLLPAPDYGKGPSASLSYVHAPESSVPSTSVPAQTPRRRRATISTGTPEQPRNDLATSGILDGTPSKRREKSKSQSNLDRHIKDVAKLELELSRAPVSSPSPRLSAVLDRSLFVAPPVSPRLMEDPATTAGATRSRSIQFDGLNSSLHHAEPYPAHESGGKGVPDSPDGGHLEGAYDRFLMATSGVKRVGRGYQSDNFKPIHNTLIAEPSRAGHARGFGVFGTAKRPMPPPASSEDAWERSTSIDELGFITAGQGTNTSTTRTCKDESKRTFVRRAIKAMVPGRTASRRLSRTIVV